VKVYSLIKKLKIMTDLPKKKFKFKIRVQAEGHDGTIKDGPSFLEAVNKWYEEVGKPSLDKYFQDLAVNDYSHYNNFEFGDSVDKEAYD
jgi:hypothetical protein